MKYHYVPFLTLLLLAAGVGTALGQSPDRPDALPRPVAFPTGERPLDLIASAFDKSAQDITLAYYTFGQFYDLKLVESGAADTSTVAYFFTSPIDGVLERIDFNLYRKQGTGTLRIKLNDGSEVSSPTSPGLDSVDVSLATLQTRELPQPGNMINQIDLSDDPFRLVKGKEYFIQFILMNSSPGSFLTFTLDGGSNDLDDPDHFLMLDEGVVVPRTYAYVSNPDTSGYIGFGNPVDASYLGLNLYAELQLRASTAAVQAVQFFHNLTGEGALDIYIGAQRVADDLAPQELMEVTVSTGTHRIRVVEGSSPDASNPLIDRVVVFEESTTYLGMIYPQPPGTGAALQLQALDVSTVEPGEVPVLVVHNGIDAGPLLVRLLDATPDHDVVATLAGELAYGQMTAFEGIFFDETLHLQLVQTATETLVDTYRINPGDIGEDEAPLYIILSGVYGGEPPFEVLLVRSDGTVTTAPVSTGVEAGTETPEAFALHGNYPNPFNPATTITFDLAATGPATLAVYDLMGRHVTTLVDAPLSAGRHEVVFDAAGLPSGSYLYRLEAGGETRQRMFVLLK